MFDFAGHTVLIAGKQDALTSALTTLFTEAGAAVALLDTTTLPAEPEAVAAQLEQHPAADCIILIPGWWQFQPFMESSAADWEAAIQQNFELMVYVAQACARRMIAAGKGGSITWLTSVMTLMPFALTSAAATTLAAFRAIVKMAAVDLAPHAIRVNSIAQGWIETASVQPHLQGERAAHILSGIPLGRAGSVQEIAQVCAFLASPLASYVTGAVIPVDGGYLLTRSSGSTPLD